MRVWILVAVIAIVQPTVLPAEDNVSAGSSGVVSKVGGDDRIERWIVDLESDRYLVREQATGQLREAGRPAFDALLGAANSGQPEAADRAVGLLQEFGRSEDHDLAMAALERLASLKRHPLERARAAMQLAVLSEEVCRENLTALGADVSLQVEIRNGDTEPQRLVQLQVVLTNQWHGSTEDLQAIRRLEHCSNLALTGAAVTDAVAESLASIPMLQQMQLFDTSVTPAAVNRLKTNRPDVIFYLKNIAQLGIRGDTVDGGILITFVQLGSAAANGGLRKDDIITQFNDHPLKHFDGLTAHIAQRQPGDRVKLEIVRGDRTLAKTVRLGSWKDAEAVPQ